MNILKQKSQIITLLIFISGALGACASKLIPLDNIPFVPQAGEIMGRIKIVDVNYLEVAIRDFIRTSENPTEFTATIISDETAVRIGFSRNIIERDPNNPEQIIVYSGSGKYSENVEYAFRRGSLKFRKYTPR